MLMLKQGTANQYYEDPDAKLTWNDRKIEDALSTEQNGCVSFCLWTNDTTVLQELDEKLFAKRPDLLLFADMRWGGTPEQKKNLSFGEICTAFVSEVSKMKRVKKVRIPSEKTNNVALLGNMAQLEYLSLDYEGKDSLLFLKSLTGLKTLVLNGAYKDYEAIAHCGKLETLKISATEFNGKLNKPAIGNLDFLSGLSDLQSLTLDLCKMGTNDFSAIPKLPRLNYLVLANSNIDNIDFIEHCTSLETLVLHRLAVPELCDLSKLSKLEKLSLEQSKTITAKNLPTAPNLKYVQLEGMKAVKNKELIEVLQKMPKLEILQYDFAFRLEAALKKTGLDIKMSHHEFSEFDPQFKAFYLRLNIYGG